MNINQLALTLLQSNPNISNNPRNAKLIEVLKSGNQEEGIRIATNLCNTYGDTPESAYNKASKFFNI